MDKAFGSQMPELFFNGNDTHKNNFLKVVFDYTAIQKNQRNGHECKLVQYISKDYM